MHHFIMDLSTHHEKLKSKQERGSDNTDIEDLCGDLEMTHDESVEGEKNQKVCCCIRCL